MTAEATTTADTTPRIDMGELSDYGHEGWLTRATLQGDIVTLTWNDDYSARFHTLWLRDHCACATCRHPQTRERMFRLIDLPAELPAPTVTVTPGGALQLDWPAMGAFDAHQSLFDPGWLRQRAEDDGGPAAPPVTPVPWDAGFADDLPVIDYGEFRDTDAGLQAWLEGMMRYGLVLLRNGPTEENEVLRAAERIGWPRETNFGRHFDVFSKPNPNNAAYTAVALEPHIDLPNWERSPDFQFLYCLANESAGGASVFTDGAAVAEALRAEDPEGFRILSEVPIDFRFQDETSDIAMRAPVIGLDEQGRPTRIRFNNWIRDSLRLPVEQVEPFYRAYRRYWELLRDPRYAIRFTLRAGEMIAFDNLRVLHGRAAFDPNTGHRHLQGCYVDRDLLRSRLRVLQRGAG